MVDLQGDKLIVPAGATLKFKGGCLKNGILEGDNAKVRLIDNCLEGVVVGKGVKSKNKNITSSVFVKWNGSCLQSLAMLCPEDGCISLNADYDYTISEAIKPNTSLSIDGKGKTIKTLNKSRNYVLTMVDTKDVDAFCLKNLVIDGLWNPSVTYGAKPNTYFFTTTNVKNVTIDNCVFQNICSDFSNWGVETDDVYMFEFRDYDKVTFTNNEIANCNVPEGLKFYPKTNEDINDQTGRHDYAIVKNNKFFFFYVSSAIELHFGSALIDNNEFGVTKGSCINAFGYSTTISNNMFHGSQASSAIDLSEQGILGWNAHDIKIFSNKSNMCAYFFIEMHNVKNVEINNNIYDGTVVESDELDRYDAIVSRKERRFTDRFLYADQNTSDVIVNDNDVKGVYRFLYIGDMGYNSNYVVAGNTVELDEHYCGTCIQLANVDSMIIKDNTFVNTGCLYTHLHTPIFVGVLPARTDFRYVKNLIISDNDFSFTTPREKCYVFSQDVYDYSKANSFLSELTHIEVTNNKMDSVRGELFVRNYNKQMLNASNNILSVSDNTNFLF